MLYGDIDLDHCLNKYEVIVHKNSQKHILTHRGLVMPYGDKDLGHCLSKYWVIVHKNSQNHILIHCALVMPYMVT